MTDEKFKFRFPLIAREHPAPTADQLRETELIRHIEMLKKEYHEAIRPYVEELVAIRSRQPLPPLIVPLNQSELAKVADALKARGFIDDNA